MEHNPAVALRKGHNPTVAMRKGHNPTVALRHRSCATDPWNIVNSVSPKQSVPNETMHYPERKTPQIVRTFAAK
jgi:hypothetical protein